MHGKPKSEKDPESQCDQSILYSEAESSQVMSQMGESVRYE